MRVPVGYWPLMLVLADPGTVELASLQQTMMNDASVQSLTCASSFVTRSKHARLLFMLMSYAISCNVTVMQARMGCLRKTKPQRVSTACWHKQQQYVPVLSDCWPHAHLSAGITGMPPPKN